MQGLPNVGQPKRALDPSWVDVKARSERGCDGGLRRASARLIRPTDYRAQCLREHEIRRDEIGLGGMRRTMILSKPGRAS